MMARFNIYNRVNDLNNCPYNWWYAFILIRTDKIKYYSIFPSIVMFFFPILKWAVVAIYNSLQRTIINKYNLLTFFSIIFVFVVFTLLSDPWYKITSICSLVHNIKFSLLFLIFTAYYVSIDFYLNMNAKQLSFFPRISWLTQVNKNQLFGAKGWI